MEGSVREGGERGGGGGSWMMLCVGGRGRREGRGEILKRCGRGGGGGGGGRGRERTREST